MVKENNSFPPTRSDEPKHVAIILDGNRRFAKRLMLEPWKGHEFGKEKVKKMLNYAQEMGVKELSFYALSVENIKSRPKNELEFLYELFRKTFKGMDLNELRKDKVKIRFVGNLSLLPEDLREMCLKLEEDTLEGSEFVVNFCIAYGGRQEITEAVKKILKNKIKAEELTEQTIQDYLYLQSEPDIVIRTGGEKRTSNFLPWQSTYSEWFFLDKMWPEFSREDLAECIEEFKKRKRRFGG